METTTLFAGRDLNLMHSLHALLVERHISRAAERVGVTQSAMSKSLGRLRAVFSDPLLVRFGGGYQLSPRAEELLGPLEEALGILQRDVFERPSFDPHQAHRTFRIAASSTTAFIALSSLISTTVHTCPGISFAVLPIDRSADLMTSERGADLVLLPSVLPTILPRERLYNDSWVLLCSETEARYGERISVDDLISAPRAVFEEDGLRTHGELLLQSLTRGAARVTTPDFMTVFHLVTGTPLIAIVQERIAALLARQNGLRTIASPVALPGFGIDMVWRRSPSEDPGAAWLREQLRANIDHPAR